MPHIFAHLDDKVRYLATINGRLYFLRTITSKETLAKYPRVGVMVSRITRESLEDLNKKLVGQKIPLPEINPVWREEREKESAKAYQDFFSSRLIAKGEEAAETDNTTFFLMEDETGKIVNLLYITINEKDLVGPIRVHDSALYASLGIPKPATFVLISDAITDKTYKGAGFLSLAFDKLLTMVSRRCLGPIELSISMSAATAIKDDSADPMHHMVNIEAYLHLLKTRLGDNIILRDRFKTGPGRAYSTGAARISEYYNDAEKLDGDKISAKIADDIKKAKDDPAVKGVGSFISAVTTAEYGDLKAAKLLRHAAKLPKSGPFKGWVAEPLITAGPTMKRK